MLINHFLEVVIKIEVKDNNVEQALRVLKESSRETAFKIISLKTTMKNRPKKEKNSTRKY